jgi:hypothetical protein
VTKSCVVCTLIALAVGCGPTRSSRLEKTNYYAACANVVRDVAVKHLTLFAVVAAEPSRTQVGEYSIEIVVNKGIRGDHEPGVGTYHTHHNGVVFRFAAAEIVSGNRHLGLEIMRRLVEADPGSFAQSSDFGPRRIRTLLHAVEQGDDRVLAYMQRQAWWWEQIVDEYGIDGNAGGVELPDLHAVYVTPDPWPATVGAPVTFDYAWKNCSGTHIAAGSYSIELHVDGEPVVSLPSGPALAPGEMKTYKTLGGMPNFMPESPGIYAFAFSLDSAGVLEETDENNNLIRGVLVVPEHVASGGPQMPGVHALAESEKKIIKRFLDSVDHAIASMATNYPRLAAWHTPAPVGQWFPEGKARTDDGLAYNYNLLKRRPGMQYQDMFGSNGCNIGVSVFGPAHGIRKAVDRSRGVKVHRLAEYLGIYEVSVTARTENPEDEALEQKIVDLVVDQVRAANHRQYGTTWPEPEP